MKIEGACHCGTITYEAVVDPDKVAVCDCRSALDWVMDLGSIARSDRQESLAPQGKPIE